MRAALVAEARDALERVNTNAFDHDLLFQYRGGVLGRELTLIVRDLADALEAAGAERDAALAAIERVRAVVKSIRFLAALPPFDEWSTVMNAAADDIVAALDGAPEPEPTDALALVEEVLAIHADRIGTHFEDCYKYHVACLAVAVKHRLAGKEKNE